MNKNFELNSYDNDYKDLLCGMKTYLKALERFSKNKKQNIILYYLER